MSNAPPMSSLRSYARPTFLPMLVLCRYYAASNVVPMLLKRPRCLDPTLSLGASQCSLLSPHPSYVFSLCSSYGPPMLLLCFPLDPRFVPRRAIVFPMLLLYFPCVLLYSSYAPPMVSLWSPYVLPMLLLCSLKIRVSFLGASFVVQCPSYVLHMFSYVLLCSSYASPMLLLCFSLCFSYAPPMLLLCSPYADVQYTPHGDRASPRRDHFFQ